MNIFFMKQKLITTAVKLVGTLVSISKESDDLRQS